MADFIDQVTASFPNLKGKLKLAGMRTTPRSYVAQNLKNALIYAIMMAVLAFFLVDKMGWSYFLVPVILALAFLFFFNVLMRVVDSKVLKREKEIDKEVLFAGRYLLIKLNSGKPLVNSLMDASKTYGRSDRYFREIVRDIELGTPIEQALENGMKFNPSKKFKRILFQIISALKIGIDVSESLQSVLDDIAEEQLIEIQRYGKKLNSFTLFYMLVAIVIPSLGMTLAVIVATLTGSLEVNLVIYLSVLGLLIGIQLAFILLFKSIRPKVNI